MRVLLVHPKDSVDAGRWAQLRWDLIVDLGWAGSSQNAAWSARFGCPVRGLLDFANWHDDIRRLAHFCGIGNERMLDSEGIDWWAVLAPNSYRELHEFILMEKVAALVHSPAEIWVTRPHPMAEALSKLLGVKVEAFAGQSGSSAADRLRLWSKKFSHLTSAQIVQIAFDKWDGDYGVRRYFSSARRSPVSGRKVLLPSAYRNVSRVLTRYAGLLPERNFLLVTTRANGEMRDLPANVGMMPLAGYAPRPKSKSTELEIVSLTQQWFVLKKCIYEAHPYLPRTRGLFEDFDQLLRNCLRMRDAWQGVLEREEVEAVMCADENNPYTRTPAMLARRRGVPTVYCSHGALDGTILFRGICSQTYLAKGEMEADYFVRDCAVPAERIFVSAAPGTYMAARSKGDGTHIVFFSEPYELHGGRTENLYSEVLPRLCGLAREHGKKVMVKLHPFESLTGRSALVGRILTEEDRKLVEVSAEPFSEQLLRKIWFSLTVESSVAVECALAGIPSFLCGWFDLDLYSYGKQYEKFGAARILKEPAEVSRVPELLGEGRLDATARERLYRPITREELEAVLEGKAVASAKDG